MRKIFFACVVVSIGFCNQLLAQLTPLSRPKLVIGIVVDQMRWDYLYRYYDHYSPTGGFRRLLNEGFSCEKTLIPYAPTITAVGHSTIYTGSVPAIHGITGNDWWDRFQDRYVYCTEDNTVQTVGSSSKKGLQSPQNLLVTTITDELRLATNNKSKVIGIALKDRGGILPAGHHANAAYWYDNTNGNWISSTYYMTALPNWVQKFNDQKKVDQFYRLGWDYLDKKEKYWQSNLDEKAYKGSPFGKGFPYGLDSFATKNYAAILTTPYGNTFTADFAKAAIINEELGNNTTTDFLAISFSSTDYVGHTFGLNAAEMEDTYLRLDKDLGNFIDFLDKQIGKGQYTVFLSSDHGASQIPEFLKENNIPAGRVMVDKMIARLNDSLFAHFGIKKIIKKETNYQLLLDQRKIDSAQLDTKELKNWIIRHCLREEGIANAFAIEDLNIVPLPARIREALNNGYYYRRSGDIQILLQSHYIDATTTTGTTHGLWYAYDAHIPLLWYGWGIKKGKLNRTTYMTDIAPTIAALLHIQEPSGNIGSVIHEVLK